MTGKQIKDLAPIFEIVEKDRGAGGIFNESGEAMGILSKWPGDRRAERMRLKKCIRKAKARVSFFKTQPRNKAEEAIFQKSVVQLGELQRRLAVNERLREEFR